MATPIPNNIPASPQPAAANTASQAEVGNTGAGGEQATSMEQSQQSETFNLKNLAKMALELLFLPLTTTYNLFKKLESMINPLPEEEQKEAWKDVESKAKEYANDPNKTPEEIEEGLTQEAEKHIEQEQNPQEKEAQEADQQAKSQQQERQEQEKESPEKSAKESPTEEQRREQQMQRQHEAQKERENAQVNEQQHDGQTPSQNSQGQQVTMSSEMKAEMSHSNRSMDSISTDKELGQFQQEIGRAQQNGASKDTVEKLQQNYAKTDEMSPEAASQTRQTMLEDLKKENQKGQEADYEKVQQQSDQALKDGKKLTYENNLENGNLTQQQSAEQSQAMSQQSLNRVQTPIAQENQQTPAMEEQSREFKQQLQDIQKDVQKDGARRDISFDANNQHYDISIAPAVNEKGVNSSKMYMNGEEKSVDEIMDQLQKDNKEAIQDKQKELNNTRDGIDQNKINGYENDIHDANLQKQASQDKITDLTKQNADLSFKQQQSMDPSSQKRFGDMMKQNTEMIKMEQGKIQNADKIIQSASKGMAQEMQAGKGKAAIAPSISKQLNALKENPLTNALNAAKQTQQAVHQISQSVNIGR